MGIALWCLVYRRCNSIVSLFLFCDLCVEVNERNRIILVPTGYPKSSLPELSTISDLRIRSSISALSWPLWHTILAFSFRSIIGIVGELCVRFRRQLFFLYGHKEILFLVNSRPAALRIYLTNTIYHKRTTSCLKTIDRCGNEANP